MKKTALLVEDDPQVRKFLRILLEKEDLAVSESPSVAEALQECARTQFDLLLLDYNLGQGRKGWTMAKEIRDDKARYGSPKIIAMSGTVGADTAAALELDKHIDLFLAKPFTLNSFRNKLATLLKP